MFTPVGVQCTSVRMVASVPTDVSGCDVPGSCCAWVGVSSGDGISAVPCMLAETVHGVCVMLSGERTYAPFLHLRASESVWIAYL